nr:reverse transcriptase domain-containing protein [Tanacetum cinerariifolium]
MTIEAEIGGHCIHRMYVDGGSASEIMYEHCFNRIRPEIKKQLVPATTSLIGFSGDIIWPIGQIQLLVRIGDEEHSASAWMNFVVVRSPSPYNGIIRRRGVRKMQAVLSTAHGMLKLPVEGGVITLKSSRLVPLECALVSGPEKTLLTTEPILEERVKRLVDKAFHKQIGRNLEVYVDDLVIKSRMEDEIIRNIEEAFKTLSTKGMKVCSDKVDVVLSLPSPKCLKDIQKLNGKLSSLNTFLAKSAEKSLPLFKTLKKCTKKSDFHWTTEAEEAFKQTKNLIAELPMLTVPIEKEELIVYLAATKETLSEVLMTEREAKQMPIYFVSRVLRGPEINYASMEKLVLALVHANGSEAGLILINPKGTEFTFALRFKFDATNNEAEYEALIAELKTVEQMGVKNPQANVDSRLVANQVNVTYVAKEMHMEKSISGVEILAVVEEEENACMTPIAEYLTEKTLPTDVKKARAIRHKSQRFAMINGTLYKKFFLEPWLRCVGPLQVNYALREIHEASCNMHTGTRSVMAKALRIGYYWPTMHKDARAHRTMIKSSNGDTSFSLTYGTKAVILAEIGMPTLRTGEVDLVQNDEALRINLDLLEEKRDQATIREAKSKAKMEKYYNPKVRSASFKPGDLMYRNNDASRVEDTGKLGLKWDGPYEVTEALGKGAYKLRDHDGKQVPRTWNVSNLKKCYIHEM